MTSTDPAGGGPARDEDVERLQAELDAARAELDGRERRRRRLLTLRKVVAAGLVVLAAFGLTASVIGVWAARTTLNTDRWVATVSPLGEDPAVQAAVSTLLTQQIFATLDVEDRVTEVLPPRAAFLAAPLTTRVHAYIKSSVDDVLASRRFREMWPALNQTAHKQIMAIINDDSAVAQRTGDTVTLNLLPVVNEVLRLLEQQAPTLFGRTLNLPTISNGQVPDGLQTRIEDALGRQLPDNFAAVTIYRGKELAAAQDAVVLFKRSVALLVLCSLLLVALALWISPTRRRTVLQLGIWLVIAVVVMTGLLRAVRRQVEDQATAGVLRDGVDAAMTVVFRTLRERGTQLLWLGVLIAAVAYLAGPGRGAVAVRRTVIRGYQAIGPVARRGTTSARTEGPGFARAHLDALRIGGAVVAGVLVLFIFSSWTSLLVIAILLGAYEMLVTWAAGAAAEPEDGTGSSGILLPNQGDGEQAAPVAGSSLPTS